MYNVWNCGLGVPILRLFGGFSLNILKSQVVEILNNQITPYKFQLNPDKSVALS